MTTAVGVQTLIDVNLTTHCVSRKEELQVTKDPATTDDSYSGPEKRAIKHRRNINDRREKE